LKTRLLAVNTPEQLETTVGGTSKTVFQVEQINNQILAAVHKLDPRELTVENNKIILVLADPLKQNPDVVQGIVSAGGRIQYVTQLNPSLEETYLKVIQETK
jgi:ABC-2 type transport system ATP-binding protein